MFVVKIKNKELYLTGKPFSLTNKKDCNQYKEVRTAKSLIRKIRYGHPKQTLLELQITDFNQLEIVEI